MIDFLIDFASLIKSTLERKRLDRRWTKLRQRGMGLGADVWLPASTWIDPDYSFLISIDAHCGFGEECLILAHDAQMDEFLDGTRVGRVRIHESCHIGARTVILPGVEIGPRTIVGAGSVISRSLPPNSVCAGNPARVICSIDEYLEKHRKRIQVGPVFPCITSESTRDERIRIAETVSAGSGYVIGGRTAELKGHGGTPRTPQWFSLL